MIETSTSDILIVYTVGGTADAVVASLKHHRPGRAVFVPSPQTHDDIQARILPMLQAEGVGFPAYDVKTVPDAQNFDLCVKTFRELEPRVREWLHQSNRHRVAVDLTGGTKLMSAALALVSRDWPCEFFYVGGSERTKDGVGVVVSGKEQVVHSANPWDSLGYQAIAEATLLFDAGNFTAATNVAERTRNRTTNLSAKRVLQAFTEFAQSYEAWDRFDHRRAKSGLDSVLGKINDLGHPFPGEQHRLEGLIRKHTEFLARLSPDNPDAQFIADLLANACRRARQGRFDDAVARLYRAVEAAAQIKLRKHGFPLDIPLDNIPGVLQAEWRARAQEGFLRLGLQDDYQLLRALGDSLGQKFFDLRLDERGSPLGSRNQSILAHGFQSVGEKVFQDLLTKTLQLVDLQLEMLPEFPLLRGDQ